MNRRDKIEFLSKEAKDIADLLSGIKEYETAPQVLLAMLGEKAKDLLKGIETLVAPAASNAEPVAASVVASVVEASAKATIVLPPIHQDPVVFEPAKPKSYAQQVYEATTQPVKKEELFEKVYQEFPAQEVKSVKGPGDIRKLLALNDRFLFQRELFHGDIGMLNYVLDEVNRMHNMGDVQRFIQEKFAWDAEAAGVAEFMVLLENYFDNK